MEFIKVNCEQCKSEFEKSKYRYNESVKNGWNFFCSIKCIGENRRKEEKVKCKNCKKIIIKKTKEIERSNSKNFFCNNKCSAIFNNKIHIKKKKKKKEHEECIFCGSKLLKDGQKKYCNNSCHQNFLHKKYIEKWKAGKINGGIGKNKEYISHHIRRYVKKKNNEKCQKCGWNEENIYTNKIPLEIHHKDGDWKNNKEDNLELLCPNCHSLTKTYRNGGGKNKIEGRPTKRLSYKNKKSSR